MKIGKQLLISYLPKFGIFISTPFLIKILTSNLTVNDYGIYSLINSIANYIFFIAGFGIPKYLGKVIPGKKEKEQYLLFNTYTLIEIIIYLTIFVVIALLSNNIVSVLNLLKYTNLILIFLSGYIFYIIYNELMRFYGLQKRLELKSLLALMDKPFIILSVLFILLIIKKFTLNYIFKTYVLVFIILFSVSFIFYKKKFIKLFDLRKIKNLPNVLLFLLPYFLIDLFFKTRDILPRYFLSVFYNNKLVGLYSFADNYSRLIFILTNSFVFIFYPYIAEAYNNFINKVDAEKNKDLFYNYLQISLKISIFIFSFGCFIAYLFKRNFILLIATKQYLKVESILLLFFLNYFFVLLISILQPIFILSKERIIIKRIYLPLLIFNILIGLFIIKYMSLHGAIYVTLITNFLLLSFLIFSLIRLIKNFLSIKNLFQYLIFMFILFLFSYILYQLKLRFLFSFLLFCILGGIILLIFLKNEIKIIFSFTERSNEN